MDIEKAICYYGVDGKGVEFVVGEQNPKITSLFYSQDLGQLEVLYEDGARRVIRPLAIDIVYEVEPINNIDEE